MLTSHRGEDLALTISGCCRNRKSEPPITISNQQGILMPSTTTNQRIRHRKLIMIPDGAHFAPRFANRATESHAACQPNLQSTRPPIPILLEEIKLEGGDRCVRLIWENTVPCTFYFANDRLHAIAWSVIAIRGQGVGPVSLVVSRYLWSSMLLSSLG